MQEKCLIFFVSDLEFKSTGFDAMGPRVTTLTNTKEMLKADLEAVKQELASEKLEKIKHQNAWIIQNEVVQNLRQVIIKLQEMYENTKDAWIAKNEEVQNLCQVISRSVFSFTVMGVKAPIENCKSMSHKV